MQPHASGDTRQAVDTIDVARAALVRVLLAPMQPSYPVGSGPLGANGAGLASAACGGLDVRADMARALRRRS